LSSVLAFVLVLPAGALAARSATVTGSITAIEPSSLTIQTAGSKTGVIDALTETADTISKAALPYVWAGGHAEAGVASVGSKGPGHNGHRVGFDCSGSVAAVLAGAGLWPAGSPVPNDAGIIAELLAQKLIARGPGQAPDEVTLYDDPGVHIFMNIDGRFFGTSDGGDGNSKGGPTWLNDGAPDASSRVYKRYHVIPSVLKDQTTFGHSLTFRIGPGTSVMQGLAVGDDVQVSYAEASSGTMIARVVGYAGEITSTGTVASVAADGSSFTVQGANGSDLTFSTGDLPALVDGLEVGDTVQVIYTAAGGALTARSVTVTATPVVSQTTGAITAIAADLSSFTIQIATGQSVTFSTGGQTSVIAGFQIGDDVQVDYIQVADDVLIAQQVDTAQAPTGPGPPGSAGSSTAATEPTGGTTP
jgi:hypothetical protein